VSTTATLVLVPVSSRPVPFRLPWQVSRANCRPVIGDALLLHYTLQKRQAREMLTSWAAEQDAVSGRRDQVVRAAVAAGLSKSEVHQLTGIARTTIDRIVSAVASAEEGAAK
jgi:hypothetical protein